MHPPIYQDNPKYAPQGYPMNISTRQPYPPYISSATATATRWSTGLCHCCDDPANCLVTCMCPCVTFGQIAEVVNKGSICKPPSNANLCKFSEFLKLKCCLLSDGIFVFWPFHAACAASGAVYGLLLGFTGLSCLYSCFYRSRLRGQYDLEEAPCVDCLVHFFCEPCALCQEYRELRNRGFDMGIGWQANMDRQSRGITVAPPVVGGGMSR
ncbi:cell number regulator 1-like [Populus alba x Populus x berolinensis]|nr:cell number regulator 1-like [Populus alba x Populus x berolinensis]